MEEVDKETSITRKKIEWDKVSWYSQLIAILLGVFILGLGYWLGSIQASILSLERENKKMDQVSLEEKVSGVLVENENNISICRVSEVERKFKYYASVVGELAKQYPEHRFDVPQYDSVLCRFEDGTYLVTAPYHHGSKDVIRGVFFVRTDTAGNITKVSDDYEIAFGQFIYVNYTQHNQSLNIISKVVDPCYLAYHSYNYDINSGEMSETKTGGELGKECWDKLNTAIGGV